jgi:hypothetical protein
MPLLIAIVGTVILIPVFLTAYFIWRRSCAQKPTGEYTQWNLKGTAKDFNYPKI